MSFSRQKSLVAFLVPAFLVAHVLCVCAPVALAATIPNLSEHQNAATADHDCRDKQGAETPNGDHAPTCQHCTHAEMGAPDSFKLTVPSENGFAAASLPPPLLAPVPTSVALTLRECLGIHGPPRILELKCVLVL